MLTWMIEKSLLQSRGPGAVRAGVRVLAWPRLKPRPSLSLIRVMHAWTQEHRTECSGSSSSSGSGGLNISSSSATDSDSSHLFLPVARSSTATEPIVPRDIARSRDEKPVQPQLRNFQKTKVGDRNRSFSVHWYQSVAGCFLQVLVMLTRHLQQKDVTNGRKLVRS